MAEIQQKGTAWMSDPQRSRAASATGTPSSAPWRTQAPRATSQNVTAKPPLRAKDEAWEEQTSLARTHPARADPWSEYKRPPLGDADQTRWEQTHTSPGRPPAKGSPRENLPTPPRMPPIPPCVRRWGAAHSDVGNTVPSTKGAMPAARPPTLAALRRNMAEQYREGPNSNPPRMCPTECVHNIEIIRSMRLIEVPVTDNLNLTGPRRVHESLDGRRLIKLIDFSRLWAANNLVTSEGIFLFGSFQEKCIDGVTKIVGLRATQQTLTDQGLRVQIERSYDIPFQRRFNTLYHMPRTNEFSRYPGLM